MRLRMPSRSSLIWASLDHVPVLFFFNGSGEEEGWDTQDVHILPGLEQEDYKEPLLNPPY